MKASEQEVLSKGEGLPLPDCATYSFREFGNAKTNFPQFLYAPLTRHLAQRFRCDRAPIVAEIADAAVRAANRAVLIVPVRLLLFGFSHRYKLQTVFPYVYVARLFFLPSP